MLVYKVLLLSKTIDTRMVMHYCSLPCEKNIYQVEVNRLERITEILNKVSASRKVLRRFAMLGTSAAFMGMLLLLLAGSETPLQAQTASITWHTTVTSALNGDEQNGHFGYKFHSDPSDGLGQITDRNFVLNGKTYHVNRLVWHAASDTFEIEFEECLKLSEVVSIKIGETTFSNSDIDWEKEEDKECADDSTDDQEFEISGVTANPLPKGTVQVDISLAASTPWPTDNPWATYVNPVQKGNTDKYGYEFDEFGSIDDRSFWYGGITYRIEKIVLDDSENELRVEFDKCLKSTDLVSVQIGSNSYLVSSLDADDIDESDADCDSSLRRNQELVFEERSNPLTSGRKEITLTFRGSRSTTVPTPGSGECSASNSASGLGARDACLPPTPNPPSVTACAVQSLEDVTDNVTYLGSWGTDCRGNSTNVPSSNRQASYSRYYSFTLSRTALLDIHLETSRLSTPAPYLYLIRRVGTSDTLVASVAPGKNGEARIIHELPKGTSNKTYTYIIEATTLTRPGVKGIDFTLDVHAHEIGTLPTSGRYSTLRADHVLSLDNNISTYESKVVQYYRKYSPYGITLGRTFLYLKPTSGCARALITEAYSGDPDYAPEPERLKFGTIHLCAPVVRDSVIYRPVLRDMAFKHDPSQLNTHTVVICKRQR